MTALRWAAALAVAALAVVVPAAPAAAHTKLSKTSPAAEATTTKPVAAVTLTFSGLVKKPGTEVVVTGPDKASYSTGDATVRDKTITQQVAALPVGTVTVTWRTVATDGHPLKGSYTFTNKAAPPVAATTPPAAATTPPVTAQPSPTVVPVRAAAAETDDGGPAGLAWGIGGGVLVVALLAGGLVWWRRRPTADS